MKRFIITLSALALMCSCDLLDQTPQSTVAPENYFRDETDLRMFSNSFYPGGVNKEPYTEQSDNYIVVSGISNLVTGGSTRTPSNSGGWSWTQLRRINTFLGNLYRCEDKNVAREYEGLAKYFRAVFYFDKVVKFGDVPWVEKELESTDTEILYGKRDSRETVMTHMLSDIDMAIDALPSTVNPYRVNRWAALALKAQFCLFEGTFRKYHGIGEIDGHDWKYYLDLSWRAAKEIMDDGPYSLAPDYLKLFANPDADKNEFILAVRYDYAINSLWNNSTGYVVQPGQGGPGMTKKFADSFLMYDGTRFTDQADWATKNPVDELKDRDPRLGACIRTPGYIRLGETEVSAPDLGLCKTGLMIAKYVMDSSLPDVNRTDRAYNDMPVIRYAEVLLTFAEARAELGLLSQDDLDISVNLLRNRAWGKTDAPHLNMQEANNDPDDYLLSDEYGYTNLKKNWSTDPNLGIILEIRRERNVELAQESRRWNDLMRWKEGNCMNQKFYGLYFQAPGEYDLTGDGKADVCLWKDQKPQPSSANVVLFQIGVDVILSEDDHGYLDPYKQISHSFDENRDYLYPIPANARSLNNNLTQNPGWVDGLSF